ncbi:MAG: hypothetical protein JNK33_01875 [Candidatus Doudnabacteria bacterium]|nr:hypothetical protein [Candidatus Doudnabacteria bacterium]
MLDVTVAAGDPEGLIKGEKTAGNYVGKDKIKWNERSLIEQKSVLDAFSPGYANQAIFASEYKPRVILLSIGGNDVGFANIVRTCIDFGEIPETCYQYYENRLQVMKTIQSQYYRLVKTYKDVRSASGGARVYVMAYPQIAKEGGNCGNNVRLTAKEVQFSAQLVSYLNSIIKRAAAEAGVYYVDTENALSGHRLCEASGSQLAVNGLTNGDDLGLPAGVQVGSKKYYAALGQESYHPNRYGHNLMGQVILAKTNNLTVTMPSPTMLGIPAIDLNSPMLKNMPHAPEQQLHTEAIQWADTSDMPAVLIQQNQYTTQIKPGTLAPSSNVQIVIHSEPVVLYEGTYMEGMQVRFSVPGSLAPGFHTIDIYGTSSDGERVDYRQLVYIAASVDDYDGDDVPNATDPCVSAYQAGEDTDADGIDDACDGLIAAPSSIAPEEVPELPVSSPLTLETSDEVNPYEDGLVAPYMEPVVEEPNPTNDDSASDQETPLVTPVITTASGSTTSNTLASVQQLARGNVAAYFGYVLTPGEETVPANAAALENAHTAILGETVPSNVPHSIVVPGSKNVQKTGTTKFVYAAIFAAILVLLVWRVRIRRKAA